MIRRLRRTALLLPVILVAALGVADATAGTTADVLLSRAKPVLTSSNENSTLTGPKAVDGSLTTRWGSTEYVDPQWIRVDLGQPASISRVKLTWEVAYGKAYRIEVSDDGTTYRTIKSVTDGNGGTDDLTGLVGHGRYVRVYGTTRGTSYGYSLWELEVYGTTDTGDDTEAPTVPAGLRSTAVTSTTAALEWTASTDNRAVTAYDVLRNGVVVGSSATTQYTDSGLTASTAYQYSVRARDLAGNQSAASAAITVTTSAPGTGNFVLAAAGDIADQCTASSSSCIHPKTAKLVEAMAPANVLTMGDNQYDDAHLSDFQNYYAKTWGRFKSITKPIPGNHETYSSPAYTGYDQYFGSAIAKPQGKRYYSWDKGNWHFIGLDSNDFSGEHGLAEPEQLTWLRNDLANNTKGCVLVYMHHARYSSGSHGDNPSVAPVWDMLVDAKVDLVLNGHDHHYERFLPQGKDGSVNSNGPVQVIGGTGGKSLYTPNAAHPATAKLLKTHGVLKLTMTDNTFQSSLIGLDSRTLDASPTYTCHS